MTRSKSSKTWLREHFADRFVQQSQKQGYRSRAVYKLLAIQEKDRILEPGMVVVDLGAAPGGWSQIVKDQVGEKGRVIALDILAMEPLSEVEFIQGDFTTDEVYGALLNLLNGQPVDLVLSDMAPNMSGIRDVDQARAMMLAELAFDAAKKILRPGGSFVVKVFQGQGFTEFLRVLQKAFTKVVVRKPPASRARSNEVYLVAKNIR
ncbi:MAG: 23S rRNA (uridine(2552)-2'-O)-methyltransferase RlmE [Gammaproteobacteria bacterium]